MGLRGNKNPKVRHQTKAKTKVFAVVFFLYETEMPFAVE